MRVKIFASDSGFYLLQEAINEWLKASKVEIKDIKYQDNSRFCSALILYQKIEKKI